LVDGSISWDDIDDSSPIIEYDRIVVLKETSIIRLPAATLSHLFTEEI